MIIGNFAKPAQFVALFCAFGIASQAVAATGKPKTIPSTITTEQGKAYQSAKLIGADPDGIVIEYKTQENGLGMIKLKFRDLPENLRQEFNYDQGAAADFEAATKQAAIEAQENAAATERGETSGQEPAPRVEVGEPQDGATAQMYPVGRFRAAGTIRGAVILDSVTGEAWLVDLHSVLDDYKDRSYFLRPKVVLPPEEPGNAIVLTP